MSDFGPDCDPVSTRRVDLGIAPGGECTYRSGVERDGVLVEWAGITLYCRIVNSVKQGPN